MRSERGWSKGGAEGEGSVEARARKCHCHAGAGSGGQMETEVARAPFSRHPLRRRYLRMMDHRTR